MSNPDSEARRGRSFSLVVETANFSPRSGLEKPPQGAITAGAIFTIAIGNAAIVDQRVL
jgi:hypothetical protein